MSLPPVGSVAPDFTLPSTSGSEVTLSQLRGHNVLLAFFPLAFTPVCTRELCAFTEDYSHFEAAHTMVLPISVDAVPSLAEFKTKEKISVDLLSDFKRDVTRAYGTLLEDKFHSNRSYVLIDKEGIIRWAFAEQTTKTMRAVAELLTQLKAIS